MKLLFTFSLFLSIGLNAQYQGRPGGAGGGANMNMGHFYGKVIDSKTGKAVEGASIQLTGITQNPSMAAGAPANFGNNRNLTDSNNRRSFFRGDSNRLNVRDTSVRSFATTDSAHFSKPDSTNRNFGVANLTTNSDSTGGNAAMAASGNVADTGTARSAMQGAARKSQTTLKATITNSRGEFSLENLPVMGSYTLRFSAVGYAPTEQKVSFISKMPTGGEGAGREQLMSMIDKDLGNIKLAQDAANLGNVTVTATKELFEMGIDRKIFNVDKNLTSSGQTATEVMKSIPSLAVDIDGNVTLRNATPQLFVDGRPTTLTMDQIPADIIDRVELITNPSAKFDASGGNAGILNIVLKKNRKTGYNGGIRAGVDSRGKVNLGGDINFRQNKINFFASGVYNQRKSISNGTTDRSNLDSATGATTSRIYQTTHPINDGYFAFIRGGFDYLIDNRNTVSVTVNYNKGHFENNDNQHIDSLLVATPSYNTVLQNGVGNFQNLGSQLSYKHNFAKTGHELTADGNYNYSKNANLSSINTQTFDLSSTAKGLPVMQQSVSDGTTKNYTFQSDYSNPITDNQKIEAGVRGAIRQYENVNNQFFYNHATDKYEMSQLISSQYKYTDQVYAGYATYSLKVKKWSYQLGLRAESSSYKGSSINKNRQGLDSLSTFNINFPFALFPSVFITRKLTDKEDLQINYSRRINRPNFFQLIPFIDYSDPYNLRVGNAGLKPEFTHSFEVSYNNNYKKGANFLVSGYFKYSTNLITQYQYKDVNPDTAHHYSSQDSVLFNTYINANSSVTYGLELTNRIPVTKWWDMTANVNIFNSKINVDATKQLGSVANQLTSWFGKLNNTIKIHKTYSIQLSGEYYAKTVLPQGGNGGQRGPFGGGPTATAQGYINPRYGFDAAVRKDWTWKGGNSASLTLSINDFLRTQLYSTYSESVYLRQTSERRRDPQILRINFAYRFGKFDVNLLKRKNNNQDQGGGDATISQ